VLNTEAHPFPTFELGKLFKTGWTRKERDADGNLVKLVRKAGEGDAAGTVAGAEAVVGDVVDKVGDAITKATKVVST
jgi:hypothetical protein